jgi:hypothetical protein
MEQHHRWFRGIYADTEPVWHMLHQEMIKDCLLALPIMPTHHLQRAAENVLLEGYHEQNGVKDAFTGLGNNPNVKIISMFRYIFR